MLLLIINNNIYDLVKNLYIFFIFDTYCKKYNFNIIYNDYYINNIFDNNQNNKSLTQNIKYIYYNINNLLINIHYNLLKINHDNNNNCIIININCYTIGSIIYELLNYYLTNDDILSNQIYYYNILNNKLHICFNQLFNKFNINYNEYICIHLYNGDIIKDTKNYLSFNYFINKYNQILNIINNKINQDKENSRMDQLIIIDYHNTDLNLINKHMKKYNIINANNISEINIFYIMYCAKYLICSNHELCDYLKKNEIYIYNTKMK